MRTYIKLFLLIYALNTSAQNEIYVVPPITATKSYQGIFGTATLQIDDAGNDQLITKPLIVAEGLDTCLMAQSGRIGDSDITTFIRDVNAPNSFELEGLLTGGTDILFGDQDYDIIYVNWDNGTDYIQRNAYVLEEVIKWVNEQKEDAGSTEPNVVLGQSMGGLIARYALADMEQDNDPTTNHDTSLYISHDAPHQGAHIPLGLLHMGRHVVNEFIQTPLGNISIPINGAGSYGLATIDDLLDAPAVNQMLINNVDTNGNRTDTAHNAWQSELQTMGYPQQTRNIALSNASHCANSQGLASNEELVTVTGEGGTSVLTSILELLFINFDPAIGTALNDTSAALLGFLPGNSNLDLEFRANAFPSSGIARIYKGRLTYEKKLLWLVSITRTIFDKSVNSQFNDKFIDNYPGGISPNALAIANNGGDTNWLYNYDFNINVNLNFDFIPATSALDVGSGNTTLNNFDYYRQYTSANPPTGSRAIPFVNFSTSSNQNNNLNAAHISFNKRNGDWLAEELDADTDIDLFDCTAFCTNAELTGEDYLCTTGTYSVTTDATFTNWTVTDPNNLVTFTTSGNEITLNHTNLNNTGFITLTAFYGNDRCDSVTVSKDVWVGNPEYSVNDVVGVLDNESINSGSSVSIPHINGALSYKWEIITNSSDCSLAPNNPNTPKFGNGLQVFYNNSPNAYISWNNCTGSYQIRCYAINTCGNTWVAQKFVTVFGYGNTPCKWQLKTYPNPLKNESFTVNRLPPDNPCNDPDPTVTKIPLTKNLVKIYDFYGNIIYENNFNSNEFNINGLKLKTGHYILNVQSSDGQVLRKLITAK